MSIWKVKPKYFVLEFIYKNNQLSEVLYINESLLESKIDKFGQFKAKGVFTKVISLDKLTNLMVKGLVDVTNCKINSAGNLQLLDGFNISKRYYRGLKTDVEGENLQQALFKTKINNRKALVICDASGQLNVLNLEEGIHPILRAVQMVNLSCYNKGGVTVVKRNKGVLRSADVCKCDILFLYSTPLGDIYLNREGKFILLDREEGFISKSFSYVPQEFFIDNSIMLNNYSDMVLKSLDLGKLNYIKDDSDNRIVKADYSFHILNKCIKCSGFGLIKDLDFTSNCSNFKMMWTHFKLYPIFSGIVKQGSQEAKILNVNANIHIFYLPIHNKLLNQYKGINITHLACIYFPHSDVVSQLKYIKIENQDKNNLNASQIVGTYLKSYSNGKFKLGYDLIDSYNGKILKSWEG